MSNFWPPRSAPKGFSIEKLARKYREKLSSSSHPEPQEKLQVLDRQGHDNVLKAEFNKPITSVYNYSHWANRDFSEYKEVA